MDSQLDMPLKKVEMNWVPDWNAFYYMTQGRLILKIDPNLNQSPCEPDNPLFKEG